jgi:hypothetical protein
MTTEADTTELVQLQILVTESDWITLFDQVEVWRSRDTLTGPFEELTADSWRPARVPALGGDEPSSPVTGPSVVIVGETLEFRLNEVEDDDITVTLSGVDPLTFTEVATQIIAQGLTKLHAYVDEDANLIVETTEPGTRAILRVLETDGAAIVGLPTEEPESLSYGRDARIPLISGTTSYSFSDIRGSTAYYYRTRFRNRNTGAFSEFSTPFSVGQATGISSSNTICGQLDLVGIDGRPLVNKEVTVYNRFRADQVEGKLVAGGTVSELTDANGHVEFILVRGSLVTVAIGGTNIVRDIEVPTDASINIFTLLDPTVSPTDDVWVVNTPNLIYAERRSL